MFLDHINSIYLESMFEWFAEKPTTKKVAYFYGPEKLGYVLFEGVDKFAIEAYNIKE